MFNNKPVVAKTIFTKEAVNRQVLFISVWAAIVVACIAKFVDAIHYSVFILLGLLVGFAVYKVFKKDSEDESYSAIEFLEDVFIVKFDYKPDLAIRYGDIVNVIPECEGTPNSIVLTGDYPMTILVLHKLENRTDVEFIEFIKKHYLKL